jgi:protein-disulfide isomerase
MKDIWRSLVLPCSIVAAAIIMAISMIWSAKIIADGLRARSSDPLAKVVFDLVRALNEKDTVKVDAPIDQSQPEIMGEKMVAGVTAGSNPVKGMASAPVLIVEFSDFQCPFTKRFYQETFPQIEKEYIATGKARFAYRDFTLDFHQFAKPAAILARCAGKQDKFWQMFDKLLSGDELNDEVFKKYTQELKFALAKHCQNSEQVNAAVDEDVKAAGGFGVEGTPAFFVNGRFVSGAQPYAVFKKIIEEELAKTSGKN